MKVSDIVSIASKAKFLMVAKTVSLTRQHRVVKFHRNRSARPGDFMHIKCAQNVPQGNGKKVLTKVCLS